MHSMWPPEFVSARPCHLIALGGAHSSPFGLALLPPIEQTMLSLARVYTYEDVVVVLVPLAWWLPTLQAMSQLDNISLV